MNEGWLRVEPEAVRIFSLPPLKNSGPPKVRSFSFIRGKRPSMTTGRRVSASAGGMPPKIIRHLLRQGDTEAPATHQESTGRRQETGGCQQ